MVSWPPFFVVGRARRRARLASDEGHSANNSSEFRCACHGATLCASQCGMRRQRARSESFEPPFHGNQSRKMRACDTEPRTTLGAGRAPTCRSARAALLGWTRARAVGRGNSRYYKAPASPAATTQSYNPVTCFGYQTRRRGGRSCLGAAAAGTISPCCVYLPARQHAGLTQMRAGLPCARCRLLNPPAPAPAPPLHPPALVPSRSTSQPPPAAGGHHHCGDS